MEVETTLKENPGGARSARPWDRGWGVVRRGTFSDFFVHILSGQIPRLFC